MRGATRRRLRRTLLLVALAAWALLLAGGERLHLPAFCAPFAIAPGWADLELILILNPPAMLAAGWLTMLLAMMPLLLDDPIGHVWQRSFARRRPRALALFLVGYAAVWMALGLLLLAAALALRASLQPAAALLAAALAALAWQVSPWKQRCLNRCHARPRLSPFGLAADRDALRFGLTHGLWCGGACWALMALPLIVASGHIAAMALVAFFLLAERQVRARAPAWRLQWPFATIEVGRALLVRGLPRWAG